jgi:hypothetical protein
MFSVDCSGCARTHHARAVDASPTAISVDRLGVPSSTHLDVRRDTGTPVSYGAAGIPEHTPDDRSREETPTATPDRDTPGLGSTGRTLSATKEHRQPRPGARNLLLTAMRPT